jgi:A/G-specific adenine glycosylase
MLQQTQVKTVVPYFERFMDRFPDVSSLAGASEDELLRYWQGLGYYRRALNLHRGARVVCESGGHIPTTAAGLMSLPGIGRYTAGAIASIAFGERVAAVDGNVIRVLSRLFAIRGSVDDRDTTDVIWSIAEALLPRARCGDFNQAWMDLGATVCVRGRPLCGSCPLATDCVVFQTGVADALPQRRAKKERPIVRTVVALMVRDGLILLRKRPLGGLWGGLWEFPNDVYRVPNERPRALRALLDRYGVRADGRLRRRGRVVHPLTHRTMCFDVYVLDGPGCGIAESDGTVGSSRSDGTDGSERTRWVGINRIEDVAISTACRKMLSFVNG